MFVPNPISTFLVYHTAGFALLTLSKQQATKQKTPKIKIRNILAEIDWDKPKNLTTTY